MKTIVVVGAGASAELGLPTGERLKQEISNLLRPNQAGRPIQDDIMYRIAYSYLYKGQLRHERLFKASRLISDSLPLAISIDNYLDAHRDDLDIQLMGKLAIVRSILAAERKCILFSENGQPAIDFGALSSTWYVKFFRLLVENCRVADLPERFAQVRFVVFNYDRCLERFLILALMRYFNVDAEKAIELFSLIEIVHPYGTVGRFDHEKPEYRTEFGHSPSDDDLLRLSDEIRTFTEGVAEDQSTGRFDEADLWTVNRVVFLGFAYHNLNMKMLFPEEVFIQRRSGVNQFPCLGTGLGFSPNDLEHLRQTIKGILRSTSDVLLNPVTCTDFLTQNIRRLSFVD